MEVILKTTNKANHITNITGVILILLGFIVQAIPSKSEIKEDDTLSNTTSQALTPSSEGSTQIIPTTSGRNDPPPEPPKEDYSIYINNSLNNSNVSVTIIDGNGNLENSISKSIADIYSNSGKSSSSGLIRSAFINKPEFQELINGNSDIIEKLNLKAHTDYLAIGKINYSMRSGTIVSGTIVCSASISMSIISTNNKSIAQSFTITNANGNGATESQAQEIALRKLLEKYNTDHSSF